MKNLVATEHEEILDFRNWIVTKWHGRPAREITRRMRVPPATKGVRGHPIHVDNAQMKQL
jgi:hypothetical protein